MNSLVQKLLNVFAQPEGVIDVPVGDDETPEQVMRAMLKAAEETGLEIVKFEVVEKEGLALLDSENEE